MKNLLNTEETLDLVGMKLSGYGSRYIAKILGISKSSVNNYYNNWVDSQLPEVIQRLNNAFEDDTESIRAIEDARNEDRKVAINRKQYGTDYHPDDVAFNKLSKSLDTAVTAFGEDNLAKALGNSWKKKPKILFYDLEVAADVALTFGRFKVNVSQEAIVKQGGFILCAAWQSNDGEIQSLHLTTEEVLAGDDLRIVAALHNAYSKHNAVCCHNSLGYDHKVLQARCAYHGLDALPLVKVLDTLALVKKNMKLPSNKLTSVAQYFGLEDKIQTEGMSLWRKVQSGDKVAMQDMLTYCKQDVVVLKQVYERLKHVGRAGSDYNAALYYEDDSARCRNCGSDHIEPTGRTVETALGSFYEIKCNDCGSMLRTRESIVLKDKRKNLLA